MINNRFRHRLPYIIAIIGIFITIFIYFIELYNHLKTPTLLAILILGSLISILIASITQIYFLIKQRDQLLKNLTQESKKELADRIHAEETKQKLEKALLQGQKLQAIGTLAGGIAHDFNNILYAIKGYVEMAQEDVEKDSLVYKNLGKVLEAALRGQELIARILAFSRRQHHDFKSIPLQETIEGVLALLRSTIPASVSINFETMKQDRFILGNQTQLHQVMVNIINNAVDAMDGEGSITIKVSQILANDELLEQFPKRINSNYCRIDIIDKGHGMDQSTMERIFEPFYTTKEVGKGTGLGLATAHAIINDHRGEIFVNSQLGQGTTFTLLLPEYEAAHEKEREHGKDFIS